MILAILVAMSAYFSATETAFSSFNRIRMKNMAAGGNQRAGLVLEMSKNYDRLLSTILIGNNIVNIASASLATVVFVDYLGEGGVTVSTVVMTVVVLIFGEISPKSLSKEAPESFAMVSAPVLKVLLWVLAPLNGFFMLWKRLLSRLFNIQGGAGVTEEELLTMVDEVQQDGAIDEEEGELIRSAIEFNDLEVRDVFTPRIDVTAVEKEQGKAEILHLFEESGYSRFPVYKEGIDNIIGMINQKDFYNRVVSGKEEVNDIITSIHFVTPSMKISKLLKLLQKKQSHMAVVTDEYGGTMGVVTMEDVIEELVGEIWDEHDEAVDEFEQVTEKIWRVSCSANLDKLMKRLNLKEQEEDADITTVGGWIAKKLDKIPREGDSFIYENYVVRVLKADRRKADEVLIEKK